MLTRRHWLLAIFSLSLSSTLVHARGKKVLFVDTGNFYRSRYAQALFNAKPPHGWTALSRGLDVSKPRKTPVSPLVTAELERTHLSQELVTGTPTALTRADLDEASVIVLLDGEEHEPMMREQFPEPTKVKVRSWAVHDTPKMTSPEAFTAIRTQVAALVAELSR